MPGMRPAIEPWIACDGGVRRDRGDAREMVATRRVRLSGSGKELMSEVEDGR